VQGVEGPGRELWDAAEVVGHLVAEGSMFAFLAAHRAQVFPDEQYADLFSPVGRPSIPATRMAVVLTLQALHELSDRECAEAVRCDLRWKVACGLSLLDEGFDPSTLVYWRRRIANSQRPHRINDTVRQVIEATGVLGGRRRRAVDSTILDDAVATQDTVTQLIAAIRRVGRQVPGAVVVIATVCTGHDYSAPGKPRIDWADPEARNALVSALVNDATAVLAALIGTEADEVTATGDDEVAAAALALLALVVGQDVEPAEGSDGRDGRWRIARKVTPDRVISTVDPQARHTRKSPSSRRDGYRAHLVAEPGTGLITDEALTMAAGPDNADPALAQQFLGPTGPGPTGPAPDEQGVVPSGDAVLAAAPTAADAVGSDAVGGSQRRDQGLTWYGDSAYGTGELRDAIERAGDRAVIKPKPMQPAVAGGFTLDDFAVDEPTGTVTCPAGQTRSLSPGRTVTFGALCRDCPLRAGCTTTKTGRVITLHEHDQRLREARAEWAADPELREEYRQQRPNIERTVSQVASHRGRRVKLRYRGTIKNNAWLKRRTAGLNLRNLIGRGLTRHARTWVLAT
jgi:IS5 family transposase